MKINIVRTASKFLSFSKSKIKTCLIGKASLSSKCITFSTHWCSHKANDLSKFSHNSPYASCIILYIIHLYIMQSSPRCIQRISMKQALTALHLCYLLMFLQLDQWHKYFAHGLHNPRIWKHGPGSRAPWTLQYWFDRDDAVKGTKLPDV